MPEMLIEDNGDATCETKWGEVNISSTALARQVWISFSCDDDIGEDVAFFSGSFVVSGFADMVKVKERLESEVSSFIDGHEYVADGAVLQKHLLDYLRDMGFEVQASEFEDYYLNEIEP